jgi:hypothetical protein
MRARAHRIAARRARRAARLGYWRLANYPHMNLAAAVVLLAGTAALMMMSHSTSTNNASLDVGGIERGIGPVGHMAGPAYRVSLPRYDLIVHVQGVLVQPELALETRVLFWGGRHRATADGELVMTEPEVAGAVRRLTQTGFEVTDMHLHPPAAVPAIVHVHVRKEGDPHEVARHLREVLIVTGTPMQMPQDDAVAPHPIFDRVRQALDREVQAIGQVLHINVPSDAEHPIGPPTEIRVQPGEPGTVIAAADFVVPDRLVSGLSKALTDGGAIMTSLSPIPASQGSDHLYRLHAWMQGAADQTLPALKSALRLLDGR